MLSFAVNYHKAINTMTADKSPQNFGCSSWKQKSGPLLETLSPSYWYVSIFVDIINLYPDILFLAIQEHNSVFSLKTQPVVTIIIPAMDQITNHLNHHTGESIPSLSCRGD